MQHEKRGQLCVYKINIVDAGYNTPHRNYKNEPKKYVRDSANSLVLITEPDEEHRQGEKQDRQGNRDVVNIKHKGASIGGICVPTGDDEGETTQCG